MHITAIIAEFNPFHNGHAYLVQQAREQYGADYVVAVMSGDWVQSGQPAILSKEVRTSMALAMGVDAVFQLPTIYATGSAERFAYGAISLISRLGCVDSLTFGCETEDIACLEKLAELFVQEPPIYKTILRERLAEGDTFPSARQKAAEQVLGQPLSVLADSNAILAIEYAKAIRRLGLTLRLQPVLRRGGAHGAATPTEASMASATFLRETLRGGQKDVVRAYVPERIWPLYEKAETQALTDVSTYYQGVVQALQALPSRRGEAIPDMTEALWNRMEKCLTKDFPGDLEGLIRSLNTKNDTYHHVSRALCHVFLPGTSEAAATADEGCEVLHLLGFRKEAEPLLRRIKAEAKRPMITKWPRAEEAWAQAEKMTEAERQRARVQSRLDIQAGNAYQLLLKMSCGVPYQVEETKPVVRWEDKENG